MLLPIRRCVRVWLRGCAVGGGCSGSGPLQSTVQRDQAAVCGVGQAELPCMQPQAVQAEALFPPTVERPLAVGGVTQDGVGQMLEVAADLRRADVGVVGAGQVAGLGRAQEAEAVGQDFQSTPSAATPSLPRSRQVPRR